MILTFQLYSILFKVNSFKMELKYIESTLISKYVLSSANYEELLKATFFYKEETQRRVGQGTSNFYRQKYNWHNKPHKMYR